MDNKKYELYHENINHTPEDFPYNTYICTIPLDFRTVKTHWHDEIEIIAIKKGEGIVCVDLRQYIVKSGDIILVCPGQLHSIGQKDNFVMEYENILFKPSLLKSSGEDSCNDNFIQKIFFSRTESDSVIRNGSACHSMINPLIEAIDEVCATRQRGYQLAVKGYLFQIAYALLSEDCDDRKELTGKKSLEKVKAILSYIEENYRNNITIEEIAGHCYYSKSYFMKFFKESMGVSFIRYLNDYRLEIAAKQLLETNHNILEIAVDTGFENLSYFNRSFKKKYGITPGKYRADSF